MITHTIINNGTNIATITPTVTPITILLLAESLVVVMSDVDVVIAIIQIHTLHVATICMLPPAVHVSSYINMCVCRHKYVYK